MLTRKRDYHKPAFIVYGFLINFKNVLKYLG